MRGLTSAVPGYAGGTVATPAYAQRLQLFFAIAHDPTALNRQEPDVGAQDRSAVFHRTPAQQRAVETDVAGLRATRAFSTPVVTQLAPLAGCHEAEAYHQGYMARHPGQPYPVVNDAPQVEQLRKRFPALYRA